MTGTGTQTNPYVIMNVNDLYSMETAGSSQTYFSLGADIDFNNTQYAEDFVPIVLNCRKFTGNGHIIRNINYAVTDKNACIFTLTAEETEESERTPVAVEGLRIENVRIAGKEVFIFGNSGGKFSLSLNRCVFVVNDMTPIESNPSTEADRHCIVHDNNIQASVDYCTFALNVYFQRIAAVFSGDTISHTQLRLDMHANIYSGSSDKYNSLFSGSSVSDSYAFINAGVYKTGSSGNITLSSTDSIFNRFYLVIEMVNSVSSVYWYGTIGSTCFYNKELFNKNNSFSSLMCSEGNSQFVHGLTTSRCKNAAYLRSIGFNCLEEST